MAPLSGCVWAGWELTFGYRAGGTATLALANNGGGLATTLVKYLDANGNQVCTSTPTLFAHQFLEVSCADNRVVAAVVYDFNPADPANGFPEGWQGSCIVNAGTTNNSNAAAYEAIPLNSTQRQLVFPSIQRRPSRGGRATNVTVQNLSETNGTTVNYWYHNSNGTKRTSGSCALAARQSFSHNHRLDPVFTENCALPEDLPDGWTGSLVVVSRDQPIGGFI